MIYYQDCAYFKFDKTIPSTYGQAKCSHPKYRKFFDGSFICQGECFRKKSDKNFLTKEEQEYYNSFENEGGDSAF